MPFFLYFMCSFIDFFLMNLPSSDAVTSLFSASYLQLVSACLVVRCDLFAGGMKNSNHPNLI